jgi:hypothetical protein
MAHTIFMLKIPFVRSREKYWRVLPINYLSHIRYKVLWIKRVDGQVDTIFPLYFHFVHFV